MIIIGDVYRAVRGHSDNRGLASFVGKYAGQGADQNAGGAHPDERPGPGEQAPHMRRHVGERDIGAPGDIDAAREAPEQRAEGVTLESVLPPRRRR